MITEFKIANFKALQIEKFIRFQPRLNVLIGLNGSGKTSLLQAIDFICNLVQQNGVSNLLKRRNWSLLDIPTRLSHSRSSVFHFCAGFETPQTGLFHWTARMNISKQTCRSTEENFYLGSDAHSIIASLLYRRALCCDDKQEKWQLMNMREIAYSGSFLSVWRPPRMAPIRETISTCSSLDLLSPHLMRSHVKKAPEHGIGLGGEFIAPYLRSLTKHDAEEFNSTIKQFYPSYDSFIIKRIQGGALVLYVKEKFAGGNECTSEATMLCDGILRIMAIVAQVMANKGGTILIDELEDGLNPELLQKLIVYLATKAPCQTIITTHSPLVLSLLTIQEAKQGVHMVYRDKDGVANCVPFFSLPTPRKMLNSYYPGEVMLRCNLEKITKEAIKYAGYQH